MPLLLATDLTKSYAALPVLTGAARHAGDARRRGAALGRARGIRPAPRAVRDRRRVHVRGRGPADPRRPGVPGRAVPAAPRLDERGTAVAGGAGAAAALGARSAAARRTDQPPGPRR